MSLTADELMIGNSGFGLFLGAGASYEAGYPLMTTLTTAVLKSFNETQIDLIKQLVHEELGIEIDVDSGFPNIETISDLLAIRALKLGSEGKEYVQLLNKIREEIVEILQSVKNPNLDYHVKLFESLRRIKEGQTSPLWIFTTNYDLLIERAAAEVGIPLYDGFVGGPIRFLKPASLKWCHGTISNINGKPHFEARTGFCINLIKLHGSIGWWLKNNGNNQQSVYACLDSTLLNGILTRAMIMPQRSKVHDVLGPPYDQLWDVASSVLGTQCKYVVSIGYSYGDDHINKKLFIPRLATGKLKLFVLIEEVTEPLLSISHFPSLSYYSKDTVFVSGIKTNTGSELWKFSFFVNLIGKYAGL
jgi:hypothetical protein